MIALISVNVLACMVIFAWASWCILHPNVRDGICGKVIFACIAFSALSVILGNLVGGTSPNAPGVSLHVCIAALGARHIIIKTLWPKVVNRIRCPGCPNKVK